MSPGRPREFDEQKAIRAALNVFWKKGFAGATCGDLFKAMGINSGSMYAAFGDKDAIYERALDQFCQDVAGPALESLNGDGSPLENIKAMLLAWQQFMSSPRCNGCFIDNTLIEFGAEKKGAAALARRATRRLQDAIENQLKAAQEIGELSSDINPTEMAVFLINTKQGLSVMARAGASKHSIEAVIKTTFTLLK